MFTLMRTQDWVAKSVPLTTTSVQRFQARVVASSMPVPSHAEFFLIATVTYIIYMLITRMNKNEWTSTNQCTYNYFVSPFKISSLSIFFSEFTEEGKLKLFSLAVF